MLSKMGRCPRCGGWNLFSVIRCNRCGTRLPWADAVLNAKPKPPSRIGAWYHRTLQKWGWLPARTLVCRFCNQPIEEHAKVCPHCHKLLLAPRSRGDV